MRSTDKKRFEDLGRQLRDIREAAGLNTHELAFRVGRGQPWISEIENATRHPDVFDFVRLCRAMDVTDEDAMAMLGGIIDDRSLNSSAKPMGPKVRPEPGKKRRRKSRT